MNKLPAVLLGWQQSRGIVGRGIVGEYDRIQEIRKARYLRDYARAWQPEVEEINKDPGFLQIRQREIPRALFLQEQEHHNTK